MGKNTERYRKVWVKLQGRLSILRNRRAEIEVELGELQTEISNLENTIEHLRPLAGLTRDPDDISGLGITDAVRAVLNPNSRMSAGDVEEQLKQRGFDFSNYSAPMSSIYKILGRLQKAGEVEIEKDGWKTFYRQIEKEEDVPF